MYMCAAFYSYIVFTENHFDYFPSERALPFHLRSSEILSIRSSAARRRTVRPDIRVRPERQGKEDVQDKMVVSILFLTII